VALGVNMQGQKGIVGALGYSKTKAAKPVLSGAEGFWLSVLTEFKNRGIKKMFLSPVSMVYRISDAHWRGLPSNAVQLVYCP